MEIVSKLQGPNKKTALNSCAKDKNCVKYGQIRLFQPLRRMEKVKNSVWSCCILLFWIVLFTFTPLKTHQSITLACVMLSQCECNAQKIIALIANALKRSSEKQRRFDFSGLLRRFAPRKDGRRDWCATGLPRGFASRSQGRVGICVHAISRIVLFRHRERSEANQRQITQVRIFLDCFGAVRLARTGEKMWFTMRANGVRVFHPRRAMCPSGPTAPKARLHKAPKDRFSNQDPHS